MIRFVHTADIHFGMENYGRIDPKSGIHTRLLDFERALNFCIDRAIEKDVDLFMFSGDAYKTAHPSPTQQRLFLQCLLRLYQAKIPVVIVVGNHDTAISFGKAHALDVFSQLPIDGFHVMAKPTTLVLQTKSGPVSIVGMPWPSRATLALSNQQLTLSAQELTSVISQKVCAIIQASAAELDPTIPAILAGHLTVSTGIFSGSEKRAIYGTDPLFLPSQLAIPPFDYVALGHLHRFQNLNPGGFPPIIYPGSIERVDFGERNEEKGFCLVEIKAKNDATYEFIPTPSRPFIQIEVKIEGETGQTEQIIQAVKKHPITDAVVKIIYHLPAHTKDRINTAAIQAACSSAHYLVGILPIRAVEQRSRRPLVKNETQLNALLEHYFSAKPELTAKKQDLLAKALALEAEIGSEEIL